MPSIGPPTRLWAAEPNASVPSQGRRTTAGQHGLSPAQRILSVAHIASYLGPIRDGCWGFFLFLTFLIIFYKNNTRFFYRNSPWRHRRWHQDLIVKKKLQLDPHAVGGDARLIFSKFSMKAQKTLNIKVVQNFKSYNFYLSHFFI